MTIAERKAREAYDQLNPWRPMKDAKADGTICELLFSDLAGCFHPDRFQYFLDSSGDWYQIDPPEKVILPPPTSWRPAWVKMSPERRSLIKRRSDYRKYPE